MYVVDVWIKRWGNGFESFSLDSINWAILMACEAEPGLRIESSVFILRLRTCNKLNDVALSLGRDPPSS